MGQELDKDIINYFSSLINKGKYKLYKQNNSPGVACRIKFRKKDVVIIINRRTETLITLYAL